MANRYDNGSVSNFNPLSLQEVMMVPLMQRQKHDQLIAQQEMLRQGLAKVDPLDVHMNEALNVKSGIENKLISQAELLGREGVNPNTQGEFLALNREYQNLISPTGRLGQINAAKQVYNKEKEDFLKSAATEKIGKDRAELLWKAKTFDYTGFDKDGNKITNVTPQGVAAFQDYDKEKQIAHSILGKTVQGLSSSGHHLEDDGRGGFWEVTRNGERIKSNNTQQVEAAKAAFKQSWLKGEGAKYVNDAGLNINEQRIDNDFNSMLELSDVRKSSENANFNLPPKDSGAGKEKTSMFNDAIQDPTTIKNLDPNTGGADFKRIGTLRDNSGTIGYDQTTHTPLYGNSAKVKSTYKDILPPIQQKFYETAARRLIASGRLPKNADLNNTENAEKIGFYMTNHMKFPTVASDIIRADVAIDNKLFSGNLASKDQGSRNRTLTQDLRQTENGTPLRTMLDVETGNKIKFETGDKVDYLGVESPINYSNYGFENKFEQSVMGHRAQILDKDGNVKANVVISRTPNEMKDPTFKKMQEINQTYKSGLNNLGEWVRPVGKYSGSKELAKTRVKVNDDNTFQIQVNGYQESPKMNNEEFIQQMQSIMEY